MSTSPYLAELEDASTANDAITGNMFGGNMVASTNSFDENGGFATTVNTLGVTSIRYPGGTVTEKFFDPLSYFWQQLFGPRDTETAITSTGESVAGPSQVFEFANSNGLGVTVVLPTASLLKTMPNGSVAVDESAVNEVKAVVAAMLEGKYGNVKIDAFEIGNEYYHYPSMTASEYGMVANELIHAVGEEITAYRQENGLDPSTDPNIAVQAGAGWKSGDAEDIIEQLDPEAREQIDELIVHYYPDGFDDVASKNGIFDQLAIWNEAIGFGDLELNVSEWNVMLGPESETGLVQAKTILVGFDELIRNGVTTASIWGLEFPNLNVGLTDIGKEDEDGQSSARLTAAGELFASLSESTVGLYRLSPDLDVLIDQNRLTAGVGADDLTADVIVTAYGDSDSAVFYFVNATDGNAELSLNIDQYFGNPTHLWGEILSIVDDPLTKQIDESDPEVFGGIPQFQSLTEDEIAENSIALGPNEILRLSVQLDGDGVTIRGHNGSENDPISLDDTLIGSEGRDSIHGFGGNDTLYGSGSGDVVFGYSGSDYVVGDQGFDFLNGGQGDDWIEGGNGDDTLLGGGGVDEIYGGGGNDILIGELSDGAVFGGSGNDILSVGSGDKSVSGGSGSDYFVIDGSGNVTLDDWSHSHGDKVTFLGQFEGQAEFLASIRWEEIGEDGEQDLIVECPSGALIRIVGAGQESEEFVSSIQDFTDSGAAAIELSKSIREGAGVDDLNSDFGEAEWDELVLYADPIILLSSLNAVQISELLNSLSDDARKVLLDSEAGSIVLGELNVSSADEFDKAIESLATDALLSVVDESGIISITAVAEDKGPESATTLERSLAGTRYSKAEEVEELPVRQDDLDQAESEQDDESELLANPDCFVASAAYRSPNHPDVWLLRWYRDEVLRHRFVGRAFIRAYWILGPALAEYVRKEGNRVVVARFVVSQVVRLICHRYKRSPGRQADHGMTR